MSDSLTTGNEVTNVAAGKPKVGGAIFAAPTTAVLPEDAVSELGSDYKCLGYISEDGLTNTSERDTTTIKAWGGDVVLVVDNGINDSFKFKLIESLNEEVLKFVYGTDNVTGTLSEGIKIAVKSVPEQIEKVLVVEMVLRGALKRIVVPRAVITGVDEIVYRDNDSIGYNTTIAALADNTGNSHYEYIQAVNS